MSYVERTIIPGIFSGNPPLLKSAINNRAVVAKQAENIVIHVLCSSVLNDVMLAICSLIHFFLLIIA